MLTIPELRDLENRLGTSADDRALVLSVAEIKKLLRAAHRALDLETRLEEADRKLSEQIAEKYRYLEESKALSRHLANQMLNIRCIECRATILGKHGDTCPHCESMLDVFFGVHAHGDK